MTPRQVAAADRRGATDRRGAGDRRGVGSLTVHPHWRVRVGGVAAPSLSDLRVLTARDVPQVAGLLSRAGCPGAVERQESGGSLVLLAWLDRERLADVLAAAAERPGRTASGRTASGRTASDRSGPDRSAPDRSAPDRSHPRRGEPIPRQLLSEELEPRQPAFSRLWPAGCVEIRWSGPVDPRIGEIAGACVEVGQLYVECAFRGHGIGRALVSAAEEHCLAAGQPRLVAALPPDMPGISAMEQAPAIVARAGYRRLRETNSPPGPLWVWRDLPEVPTRR